MIIKMFRPLLIVILGATIALAACSRSENSAPAASPTPAVTASATPSPDPSQPASPEPATPASPVPNRPGDAEPNPGGGDAVPQPAPATAGVRLYRQDGSQIASGGQVIAGELIDVRTGVGTFAPGSNVDYVMGSASGPVQFTAGADGSVQTFTLDAPLQSQCHSFAATDTAGTVVVTEVCVS